MKSEPPPAQYKLKTEVEDRIMRMALFFRYDVVEESRDPLSALLKWTSELNCQHPRDHIYAMLGFIHEKQDYPKPDYSTHPVTVFTEFAKSQILKSKSLAIFHDRACRTREDSIALSGGHLPSWVPDWTIKAVLQRPFALGNEHYFNASRGLPFQAKEVFASDRRHLKVQGIQISRTTRVASGSIDSLGLPETLEFIEDAEYPREEGGYLPLQRYNHDYPTGEPLIFALLRTCVLDIDFRFGERLSVSPEHALLLKEISEGFLLRLGYDYGLLVPPNPEPDFMEKLMDKKLPPFSLDFEFLPRQLADKISNPPLESWEAFKIYLQQPGNSSNFQNLFTMMFDRHMGHLAGGRTLFMTEKGYFGLSTSARIQAGDILAILGGCTTPVILRKVQGESSDEREKYQFVSDAFVHGLMDGEAFDNLQAVEGGQARQHDEAIPRSVDDRLTEFVIV